jgi:hypothetical protein
MTGVAGKMTGRSAPAIFRKNLLRDAHFQDGLAVQHIDPPTGPRDPNDPFNGDWIAGLVQPSTARATPVWRAAQWYSRFNLADATRHTTAEGGERFFDGGKTVTFGAQDTPAADVSLRLNGRVEWNDTAPQTAGSWPHLLVQQTIEGAPVLAEMTALRLRASYRLTQLDIHHLKNQDDARHAAKFSLFITLRNRNRESVGYGDYLWFGVPFYDSRYEIPRRYVARDAGNGGKRGTNKFIYNPGGLALSVRKPSLCQWLTLDQDLAGLMKEAMTAAWAAGYLPHSKAFGDYALGAINLGWETSAPIDAEMQVKNLALEL